MLGVVFASEEEASPFLSHYKRGRFEGLREGEVLQDDTLLVSITGTGKIKATLRTERLLRAHTLTRLLHVGSCSALTDAFALGSVVAAEQVLEGDRIELAAPAYPRMPLAVPFEGLQTGTLVTQDHTWRDKDEPTYWQRIAQLADMTGYAVSYVTATHGIPCYIVKAVAGFVMESDTSIRKNKAKAHEALARFLVDQAVEHLAGLKA
ncbi:MAG: 5'-methylthioadenosine nucleosidase [Bacteroidota bacterium]